MKKAFGKWFVPFIALAIMATSVGCRRGPSEEPPKYYQRELARMAKEEAKRAAEEAEKKKRPMSDRYPWRGKNSDQEFECVPCRIKITEVRLSDRINYLTEVVHGKKKGKIKFRY